MTNGEQYVMMTGTWLMPPWFVANLALLVLLEPQQIHSLKQVIIIIFLISCNDCYSYTAASDVPIVFDEVQCTGAEGSLGECTFVTDHDCDHTEEAGVICIGNLLMLIL